MNRKLPWKESTYVVKNQEGRHHTEHSTIRKTCLSLAHLINRREKQHMLEETAVNTLSKPKGTKGMQRHGPWEKSSEPLPTYSKPSKTYNMQLAFAYYLLLACYFLSVLLQPQKTAVFLKTVFVVKARAKRDKLLMNVILVKIGETANHVTARRPDFTMNCLTVQYQYEDIHMQDWEILLYIYRY